MYRFGWLSRKGTFALAFALACLVPAPLGATAQGITGGGRFVPPPDQRPVMPPRPAMPARPAMPPRDVSGRPRPPEAPVTGTASISGRVVDADTGTPLRRVSVGARASSAADRSVRMTVGETDDTGAYMLRSLPAGQYTVTVQRAGYVTQSYGQTSARSMQRRLTVDNGSRVTSIDFRLVRGGAITGRVVDDGGEPAEGVAVRVMIAQRSQGRLRYVPAGGRTDITDDLGQFRLYGLAPGEYLVSAEPNVRRFMGGTAPSATPDATHVVVPTYAPGTSTPADAQRFVLTAGQEVVAEIQLVASRVATVSGRVLDSSGAPFEGGVVRLVPQDVEVVSSRGSERAGIVGGAFRLERVVPGAYTLTAMGSGRRPVAGADQGAAPESASVPVVVSGEGVEGLVITTAPPSTLTGRIIVEGEATALVARSLRIVARSTEPGPSAGGSGSGRVSDDLTVRVTGLRGSQRLSLTGLPRGWWVKSVQVNGLDALEGLDFGTGRQWTGLEVVVNNRPAFIGGQVTTAGGQPAADYAVLAFPQDFDARANLQLAGISAMSRPDQSGTWVVESLRPGDYFVLATPPGAVDMSVLDDVDALRTLSGRARRVTVREGEQQVLNLILVEP